MTQVFLGLLMVSAAMTTLFTEAMKKLMDDTKIKYSANVVAGVVAVAIAGAISAAYVILNEVPLDAKVWVYIIGLVLLSWLCAMVGYDKVKQTLLQISGGDKDEDPEETQG